MKEPASFRLFSRRDTRLWDKYLIHVLFCCLWPSSISSYGHRFLPIVQSIKRIGAIFVDFTYLPSIIGGGVVWNHHSKEMHSRKCFVDETHRRKPLYRAPRFVPPAGSGVDRYDSSKASQGYYPNDGLEGEEVDKLVVCILCERSRHVYMYVEEHWFDSYEFLHSSRVKGKVIPFLLEQK